MISGIRAFAFLFPLQYHPGALNLRCERLNRRGSLLHFRLDFAPVFFLDCFPNAGYRLYSVAGVKARRVYLMSEPWSPWQPLLVGELPLRLIEKLVERLHLLHIIETVCLGFT